MEMTWFHLQDNQRQFLQQAVKNRNQIENKGRAKPETVSAFPFIHI